MSYSNRDSYRRIKRYGKSKFMKLYTLNVVPVLGDEVGFQAQHPILCFQFSKKSPMFGIP